jgi:hypothetical protein
MENGDAEGKTMTPTSFHPTGWTHVLRTRGEGEDAKAGLLDLCAACYERVIEIMLTKSSNSNTPGYLNV